MPAPSPPILVPRPPAPALSTPPPPHSKATATPLLVTFYGLDLWSLLTSWGSGIRALLEAQESPSLSLQGLSAPGMCASQLLALNTTALLNTSLTAQELMPGLGYFATDVAQLLRDHLQDSSIQVQVPDFCAGNRTVASFIDNGTRVSGPWPTLNVTINLLTTEPESAPPVSQALPLLLLVQLWCPHRRTDAATHSSNGLCFTTLFLQCKLYPTPARTSCRHCVHHLPWCQTIASVSFASVPSAWLRVAGSEVECVVPVGTAAMDQLGGITNTAYQLSTCYVYYYSHAVRTTLAHTRLTFTRADGSSGQLAATPTHPYFAPGHPVPLTPALPPASAAAAGNATRARGHAQPSREADTQHPATRVNVPGGWKPFGDVVVGDLVLLRDASSGQLHTTTITAVERVLEYGSFSPLLQGNALIVLQGVAVYTMVLAAHHAATGPYRARLLSTPSLDTTSRGCSSTCHSCCLSFKPAGNADCDLPWTAPWTPPHTCCLPAAVEPDRGVYWTCCPLWRHCLEHWAISPGLSQSWQCSSPPLASQLALVSTGQLPLVLEPMAPDAYLDMTSVPTALQPAVRKLLGGCVQLGSRLSDLPFFSSLVDTLQGMIHQHGVAGAVALVASRAGWRASYFHYR
ncbi:hypothetical protein QJQ45_020864, partial [Haematococcus lacustris]